MSLPFLGTRDRAFKVSDPLGLLILEFNEAQSLQPEGLRPTTSLSTLNARRYRLALKTRYGMCWVSTFPVALSATSSPALRGAPDNYSDPIPCDSVAFFSDSIPEDL